MLANESSETKSGKVAVRELFNRYRYRISVLHEES